MPNDPAVVFLGIYSKEVKAYVQRKAACEGKIPKLETAQTFRGEWMVKQTVVHSHNGILLSNKEEWAMDTHNNLNESQGNDAEWEKSIPNGYLLSGSIDTTFLKWHSSRDGDQLIAKGKDKSAWREGR